MPQQQYSLAGTWDFQLDPDGVLTLDTLAPDRAIPVPLPWQAAFPDLQQYSGYAWYRTGFDVPDGWLEGELLLRLGAVDYWCQIFINGHFAGEHEGGYTPITLPIRRYVQAGGNTLVVRVYDSVQASIEIPRWPEYPPHTSPPDPPFDANHIPHGKQEWYINVGGIWQDVTLTAVPATYIDHVRVTPDIRTGSAVVVVELAGAPVAAGTEIQVLVQSGSDEWSVRIPLSADQRQASGSVTVPQARLWTVEDPFLYQATVQVMSGDNTGHLQTVRFGYREISTRDGQVLLNGEPLFLLCALDQDLYPETIYTVPSEEYLRDQFRKAKELGLNMLRCHIKPADPRYLDLADEMGILVWAEIPSWRTFYPKGTAHANLLNLDDTIKRRAEVLLEEMIRRDCNHPSIVIWTLINEDWGTALPLSASDRAWVKQLYHQCKALDPTRLVVDNSACPHAWGPNIHVESDLDDFHVYANIPDQARHFEHLIEQFAMRPLWSYSSQGDSTRSGQEPLILSEFGNWGLPTLAPIRDADGKDPSWFHIGPWWSPWDGEPGWPAGVEERFKIFGLDRVWPDYDSFARATQWHQFAAMKFEIETMRCQPNLQGYVITEFTDAYWESNGLLDFARHPKEYHDRFAEINSPDLLIPRVEHRYAYWDDQEVQVSFYGAHYSAASWLGAQLCWAVDGQAVADSVPVASLPRGTTRMLGALRFALPKLQQSRTVQFTFWLQAADGSILSRNRLDLLVIPAQARERRYTEPLSVVIRAGMPRTLAEGVAESPGATDIDIPGTVPESIPDVTLFGRPPSSALEGRVRDLGYETTQRLIPRIQVAVSDYTTPALLQWVRDGGDLLFLTRGPSPFFWVHGRGGPYGGSWMTSFSWVRPDIHPRLHVVNPLSMPYINVMPHGTIVGLPTEDPAMHENFLAGLICGWVHTPSVHTVQFRYGKGRVVMTTLAIEDSLAYDPVAVAMFHDLVEYLASDACQPTLVANY
ncbi:MAG TPA: glycoside hydrolase family 2 TIM barrel-domain containing protein [Chloroflexia bacterium]|nr:glycoside hydrolase family 2 TIM barrel-domain containing protein [Chloroflexia bacterium]